MSNFFREKKTLGIFDKRRKYTSDLCVVVLIENAWLLDVCSSKQKGIHRKKSTQRSFVAVYAVENEQNVPVDGSSS